ncbi:hypothetical protein [Rhodoferax ferrireducens]
MLATNINAAADVIPLLFTRRAIHLAPLIINFVCHVPVGELQR